MSGSQQGSSSESLYFNPNMYMAFLDDIDFLPFFNSEDVNLRADDSLHSTAPANSAAVAPTASYSDVFQPLAQHSDHNDRSLLGAKPLEEQSHSKLGINESTTQCASATKQAAEVFEHRGVSMLCSSQNKHVHPGDKHTVQQSRLQPSQQMIGFPAVSSLDSTHLVVPRVKKTTAVPSPTKVRRPHRGDIDNSVYAKDSEFGPAHIDDTPIGFAGDGLLDDLNSSRMNEHRHSGFGISRALPQTTGLPLSTASTIACEPHTVQQPGLRKIVPTTGEYARPSRRPQQPRRTHVSQTFKQARSYPRSRPVSKDLATMLEASGAQRNRNGVQGRAVGDRNPSEASQVPKNPPEVHYSNDLDPANQHPIPTIQPPAQVVASGLRSSDKAREYEQENVNRKRGAQAAGLDEAQSFTEVRAGLSDLVPRPHRNIQPAKRQRTEHTSLIAEVMQSRLPSFDNVSSNTVTAHSSLRRMQEVAKLQDMSWPAPVGDSTLPKSDSEVYRIYRQILGALSYVDGAQDLNAESVKTHWGSDPVNSYDNTILEHTAWRILALILLLHEVGSEALDPADFKTLKWAKDSSQLKFVERVQFMLLTLVESKFICDEAINSKKLEMIVGAPIATLRAIRNQATRK